MSVNQRLELIPESLTLADEETSAKTPQKSIEPAYLIKLFQLLSSRFDEGEVKTLCFSLRIDYDSLPDQGKENKIREMISYLERRNRLTELVETGRHLRPDINWNEF